MQVRCAIVDDEQPARELLENFSNKISALRLIGKFKSPLEIIDLINEQEIDLLFLDIQMQEMKGTEFLRTIKNGPEVILTTAYPDYALEGYDLSVADYLLKPFSFERFLQAVNKTIELIQLKRDQASTQHGKILKIKTDRKIYQIAEEDILYIEGLKEYVSYYTKDGERIIALQSMKDIEQALQGSFIRTHRSYIVRFDQVRYLEGNSLMLGEKRIPIGASYKEKVIKRFS